MTPRQPFDSDWFTAMAMKCASVLLVLLACLWLAGPARATADGPDFYRARGIAPGASIAMLAAPRADAPRVGRIGATASCLRSLGCQGGLTLEEFSTLSEAAKQQRLAVNPRWCQVAYQGRIGWVPGQYLAESSIDCADAGNALALAGSGNVVLRGQIRGDRFVDYLIQGRAGQTLRVSLKGSHPQNFFNLTPSGSPWAMFVGSISSAQLERRLPVDGLYAVRVYLMRAAARRNATSRYTLSLDLAGEALQPRDPAQDALVAGTPYHAQATIPCRRGADPGRTACDASVIRYQRMGSASVELRWTEGPLQRVRRLLFVEGRVVGSDATDAPRQSGTGDPYRVDVGSDEHYEVPHALVSGG